MVNGMDSAMDRRVAVAKLLAVRDGALVVTGLGSPSYDVHAAGDADNGGQGQAGENLHGGSP